MHCKTGNVLSMLNVLTIENVQFIYKKKCHQMSDKLPDF